jgi:hypothetical protein
MLFALFRFVNKGPLGGCPSARRKVARPESVFRAGLGLRVRQVNVDRRDLPRILARTSARKFGEMLESGGGRFTGMPRITLRLRYLTLKLSALCWVLWRLRAGGRLSWPEGW